MQVGQMAGRQLTVWDLERYGFDLDPSILASYPWVYAVERTGEGYRCSRCDNTVDFAKINGKGDVFCCHCLQLGRMTTFDKLYRIPAEANPGHLPSGQSVMTWSGNLSLEQKRASQILVKSLDHPDKIDIIHAVTGAGKTEMIFAVIDAALSKGGRVGLVSPRIDVCLELGPRLQAAFSKTSLLVLYGAMTEAYHYTDLVVATNHQLWRFYQAFDLIIVDEVDAFPLLGDGGLHFGVKQALKPGGKLIYLTATPDAYLEDLVQSKAAQVTLLPARYHGFALPEPDFVWIGNWQLAIKRRKYGTLLRQLKAFLSIDGVRLIFMPHIELAQALFDWLQDLGMAGDLAIVHAKDPDRAQKVQAVRDGDLSALITTTILERGVTFSNCHVFILGAEHPAFSASALVQMSGRVGRKADFPTGRLIYGHYGVSRSMKAARQAICLMNKEAHKAGLIHGGGQ